MTLPLIFIVGPTAIGKSSFAINLAKKINGEIINADSMQVYKDLNILTARPSKEDIKTIPHHLYGYIKGEKRYAAAAVFSVNAPSSSHSLHLLPSPISTNFAPTER